MKLLENQNGMALVTSLMLTLISLTIVMYLMYMITAGTKMSGANKRYKTVLEASYGSAEIITKDIFPILFAGVDAPATRLNASGFALLLNISSSSDECLKKKLTGPATSWGSSCSSTLDAKTGADITLQLNSASSEPFTVYTKIVETVCSDPRPYPAGNCTGSDLSGAEMLDSGVGVAGAVMGVAVQHYPATYRIEIQAERSSNLEKSKLSVLYAY